MADPIVVETPSRDETSEMEVEGATAAQNGGDEEPKLENTGSLTDAPTRVSFIEYLKSAVVQLCIGSGADMTILNAHEDLLTQSVFFEQACAELTPDNRNIYLPDEDLEAMGSFIEYLYRGDYFPRYTNGALERDPSVPDVDTDGTYLLKHARIYTLAEKFGIPALRSLAHKKIQGTTSTARGEISYARYVYASTSADDATIRRPVAAFWATRSHTLRHEAEEEFRAMCLEHPQFGFDVLSMVLDQREKRASSVRAEGGGGVSVGVGAVAGAGVETPKTGVPARKRARMT